MVSPVISKVDHLKACRRDGIPPIVIKKCVPKQAPILFEHYNICLAASIIQDFNQL